MYEPYTRVFVYNFQLSKTPAQKNGGWRLMERGLKGENGFGFLPLSLLNNLLFNFSGGDFKGETPQKIQIKISPLARTWIKNFLEAFRNFLNPPASSPEKNFKENSIGLSITKANGMTAFFAGAPFAAVDKPVEFSVRRLGKLTQAKTKVFARRSTGFSLFNFPLKPPVKFLPYKPPPCSLRIRRRSILPERLSFP